MPNGLFNWCYKDVAAFLKDKGFKFQEYRQGSHETWVNKTTEAIVDIDFHRQKSFPPRTLETMIRQSKINKKEWRKWVSR